MKRVKVQKWSIVTLGHAHALTIIVAHYAPELLPQCQNHNDKIQQFRKLLTSTLVGQTLVLKKKNIIEWKKQSNRPQQNPLLRLTFVRNKLKTLRKSLPRLRLRAGELALRNPRGCHCPQQWWCDISEQGSSGAMFTACRTLTFCSWSAPSRPMFSISDNLKIKFTFAIVIVIMNYFPGKLLNLLKDFRNAKQTSTRIQEIKYWSLVILVFSQKILKHHKTQKNKPNHSIHILSRSVQLKTQLENRHKYISKRIQRSSSSALVWFRQQKTWLTIQFNTTKLRQTPTQMPMMFWF